MYMIPRVSELRKLLLEFHALKIFAVKSSTILETSKEYWMIFLRNLIEAVQLRILLTGQRLNLGELQVDDISAKFTAESTEKYIPNR